MATRLLRALRRDAPALLLSLALALAASWPLAANFFARVPGDLIADRDQNLWNLWWVRVALLDRFTNPFHTTLLYYPDGVDLYAHTLALPNGLIGLLPQLLFGLPAAYNSVVLFALTLAVYGGFRFVRYCLLRAGYPAGWSLYAAALVGGIAYGLNAYGLDALKGQTEVLSYGWMPLYAEALLRAWDTGRRKVALLAGLLFGVTILTSLYYAVYLVLFTLGFLAFQAAHFVLSRPRKSFPAGAQRATVALVALGLLPFIPYMAGLAASVIGGGFQLSGAEQQGLHSADLLDLFSLRRAPVWLGLVAPLLGLVGLVAWRRRAGAWGLAAGALGAVLLALGAVLLVGGMAHPGVPLPWALLRNLPVFSFVGKVERFEVLARLLWAPLVGAGVLAALGWAKGHLKFAAILLLIGALLLVDVPWRAQPMMGLAIPAGFAQIKGEDGALFELPLAAGQVQTMGERMVFQTEHGRPIVGGYLARSPSDPLPQSAPVWGLITWQPNIAASDVITPHVMAQPLALMQGLGLRYYAVYNYYDPALKNAVAGNEMAAFKALAAATSEEQPVFSDDTVTIYRVRPESVAAGPALQLGAGWGGIEKSGGEPFRWMQGAQAGLCVQNAAGKRARLTLSGTSFADERTLEISAAGKTILRQTLPAGGQFVTIETPLFAVSGDSMELSLRALEGSASPAELGLGQDTRSLSMGFSGIKLEIEP